MNEAVELLDKSRESIKLISSLSLTNEGRNRVSLRGSVLAALLGII